MLERCSQRDRSASAAPTAALLQINTWRTCVKKLIQHIVLLSFVMFAFATAPALAQETRDPELRKALLAAVSDTSSFPDRFEAEVWLIDMSRRLEQQVKDPEERIKLLTRVHQEASRAELPPELILSVIEVESNFDRYAVSVAGALGLMQIMPFWREEIGRPDDNLLHLDTNLRYGCTILKFYLEKEQGDLRRALGRYNGSLGKRKYPNKVIDKLTRKWFKA
jgi:soluble lytic murein transglycosylase-like protein